MEWSDAEIRIDKDCLWYCDGVQMTREDIVELLSRNVVADKAGEWLIKFKNQSYPVLVEDVPFLVKDVICDEGTLKLKTNDNRLPEFPNAGVEIRDGIPYVSLFNRKIDAKFSRSAYWKLNKYVEEVNSGYAIVCAGKKWPVKQGV